MNVEINDWLNSARDYHLGVQLYDRFGQSQSLKRIFSRGDPSESALENLVYELSKSLDIPDQPVKTGTHVNRLRIADMAGQPATASEIQPDADRILYQDLVRKMKIRDLIHATLGNEMPEDKRKNDAFQILALSEEISEGYERIAAFKKTGILPPSKIRKEKRATRHIASYDREGLVKERNNVRSHVSRNKKLAALTDIEPKLLIQYHSALVFWQARLKDINKALAK
jgi:hypothetical protein